jgi:hypothetical protein
VLYAALLIVFTALIYHIHDPREEIYGNTYFSFHKMDRPEQQLAGTTLLLVRMMMMMMMMMMMRMCHRR